MASWGSDNPDIMIIGEAPGENENRKGRAFVGNAGKKLMWILEAAGIPPDEIEDMVRFSNIARCVPWNDTGKGSSKVKDPPDDAIAACTPYLLDEIEKYKPKVIVPAGRVATKFFTGLTSITKARGGLYKYRVNGTQYDVLPTYHPAALLYKDSNVSIEQVVADIHYACLKATGQDPLSKANYRVINSEEEVLECMDKVTRIREETGTPALLAIDIETNGLHERHPNFKVVSLQLSQKKDSGVLIPVYHKDSNFWTPKGMKFLQSQLQRIRKAGVPITNQNVGFDMLCLWVFFGVDMSYNIMFDTMLAHHFLWGGTKGNDLETMTAEYLQIPVFKGEMKYWQEQNPGKTMDDCPFEVLVPYGCQDSDYAYQLTLLFMEQLRDWHGRDRFDDFVKLAMEPLMLRIDMEFNGARIDRETFRRLQVEFPDKIQSLVEPIERENPFYRGWQKENAHRAYMPGTKTKKKIWVLECTNCNYRTEFDPTTGKPEPKRGDVGFCGKCDTAGTWRYRFQPVDADEEQRLSEASPIVYPKINWNSSGQVADFLFDVLMAPKDIAYNPKTKKQGTTDKTALKALAEYYVECEYPDQLQIVTFLLEHRKHQKLYSSYIKTLEEKMPCPSGRTAEEIATLEPCMAGITESTPEFFIYTRFKQHGTATGRWSSEKPNMQQMPKGRTAIKRMFISRFPGGLLVDMDLSQTELRIFANESGDPVMRKAIEDGVDIHKATAAEVYGVSLEEVTKAMRSASKAVNFGIIYGMGAATLAWQIGASLEEAKALLKNYFKKFPGVKAFVEKQHELAKAQGYAVASDGRIYMLPGINSGENELEALEKRRSVNYVIQGPGSDFLVRGGYHTWRHIRNRGLDSTPIVMVHDSLLIDTPPYELLEVIPVGYKNLVETGQADFDWMKLPMKSSVDIGVNWEEQVGVDVEASDFDSGIIAVKGPVEYARNIHTHLSSEVHTELTVKSEYEEEGIPCVEADLCLKF